MRLFIAITFNEELKAQISLLMERLRPMALQGSFTLKDNLHLTLIFIGETKRVEEVKLAMTKGISQANIGEFDLLIKGIGSFKRREGDIYWLGIEQNLDLLKLQKMLLKGLKEAGFYDIDDREYKPHLTLGRRVRMVDGFQPKDLEVQEESMHQRVTKISLMSSERIKGRLVYTEIYHVDLDKC